jgi:hypothetical protein
LTCKGAIRTYGSLKRDVVTQVVVVDLVLITLGDAEDPLSKKMGDPMRNTISSPIIEKMVSNVL